MQPSEEDWEVIRGGAELGRWLVGLVFTVCTSLFLIAACGLAVACALVVVCGVLYLLAGDVLRATE